ncbi:MAG: hypothetical protein H7841_05515 [Magnetospirillum sp. WYHS-4]
MERNLMAERGDGENPAEVLERLRAAIEANRIDEAVGLAMSLGEDPDLPAGLRITADYLRGVALAKGGRHSQAADAFRQVVKAVPNSGEAAANLAGVLLQRGRNVEALLVIEDCRQSGGSGADLDKLKALALGRLRRPVLRRMIERSLAWGVPLLGVWTLLTGVYAWTLILRTPRSVARLVALLAGRHPAARAKGAAGATGPLAGFTEEDTWFRPYYRRLARTLRNHGRFGYAFEWCFGLVLADLYFISSFTYRLYAFLGDRLYAAASLLLAVLVPLGLAAAGGPGYPALPWLALYAWVLAGSPMFGVGYLQFGKPELLWWPTIGIVAFLLFGGHDLAAGLLWSGLAIASVPVAVLGGAILAPATLAHMILASGLEGLGASIGSFLAGAAVGIGLILGRIALSLHLKDVSGGIVKGQSFRSAADQASLLNDEIPFVLPMIACTVAAGLEGLPVLPFAVLGATVTGLYLVNDRLWKINDQLTFDLAAFAAFWALAAAQGGLWTLAVALAMILRPRTSYIGHPASDGLLPLLGGTSWRAIDWPAAYEACRAQLTHFPRSYFRDYRAPLMPSLDLLADAMPPHSRLMGETSGHVRFENPPLRALYTILWESLSRRGLELVNDDHAVTTAGDMVEFPLSQINGMRMTGRQIDDLCRRLGVRFLLAHTRRTHDVMLGEGWSVAASAILGERDHLDVVNMPPKTQLILLRAPERDGDYEVVQGVADSRHGRNLLAWTAAAGRTYVVRYRHHRYFRATQDGRPLRIDPVKPFADKSLTFMQVTAEIDGPLELRFRFPPFTT